MNPNLVAGLPPVLLQIVAWVLGEYGALVSGTDMEVCPLPQVMERLCAALGVEVPRGGAPAPAAAPPPAG